MASLDGVVVFMGKLRRIHEFLTNTKMSLRAMSCDTTQSEEARTLINNRLYEVNYILDKFWEIIEGE